MGLKCPKCGTDNLLTAIFCRGCGDKLDLNEMKPEAILNDKHTKQKNHGATKGQKIATGIIGGIIAIILLLAICPAGSNGTGDVTVDDTVKAAFGKLLAGKKAGVTANNDAASHILTEAMKLPKDKDSWSQGPFVPQHFSVDFKSDNQVKIVVKAKAFGAIPVTCGATATIEGSAKNYNYTLSGAKLGQLPLVVAPELSTDMINTLLSSCKAIEIAKKASSITTTDGNIEVKF